MIDKTKIRFRKWNADDATGVRQVLKSSWRETYSPFILQQDLDFYLDKFYSVNALIEVCSSSSFICYVAEYETTICGWLKLTINSEENRFYLSSIYVLPEFQKKKIGERFFEITCEEANKNNFNEIYIGVMKENKIAFEWYKKLGFEFNKEELFTMGTTDVVHYIGRLNLNK